MNKIFGVKVARNSSTPHPHASITNNSINPTYQPQSAAAKTALLVTETPLRKPGMDTILSLKKKPRSQSNDKAKDKNAKPGARAPKERMPVKLDVVIESPPILFIDAPAQSSGALISGLLQMTAAGSEVLLDSVAMYLECTTTTRKPVQERCRECTTQVQDLYEWHFLRKPKPLTPAAGTTNLPFSHLIPGHIPVTTHGHLGTIDYSLHVRAKCADGREAEYRQPLIIRRALRPGNDKNSMRVFPPTFFTVHVTLANIVHPIGEFPVTFRMMGITDETRPDKQHRWRLRKLTWRIEQLEVVVSPACSAHAAKVGGEGKGIQHKHEREIGCGERKAGWKTDFTDSQIDGEFSIAIDHSQNPQTGVDATNGTRIHHNLVLEFVIAEEWAPNKKLTQATPTGAARVLRTQFALQVTDRAGLGIAWDDEQPPMYEDVPASPPHYRGGTVAAATTVTDYTGEDLSDEIEDLSLGEAPAYRE